MQRYDKESLKELAKDPHNVVYDVKYDDVEYTPMKDVRKLMMIVRGLSGRLRSEHEDWTDEQIREEIALRSPAARKMKEKTHPHLFKKITDRNLSEQDAVTIAHMVSLYEKKEQGKISQEDVETAIYCKILKDAGVGES